MEIVQHDDVFSTFDESFDDIGSDESDPARITLKPEYTKDESGDRTVFLTTEAEKHVRNYLEWRKGKKKSDGTELDANRLFPITKSNANRKLRNAIDRSHLDIGRDEETGIREIHMHSTRKFFRSKCGLNEALTKALMGHKEGLDRSYLRVDPDRLPESSKTTKRIWKSSERKRFGLKRGSVKAISAGSERL